MRKRFYISIGVVLLVALSSVGERWEFSPEVLELRTRTETRIFNIPVYYSAWTTQPLPIAQFLKDDDFWQVEETENPKWIPALHRRHWWAGDGTEEWFKALISHHDDWIAWTEANPELAKTFWVWLQQVLKHRPIDGQLGIILYDVVNGRVDESRINELIMVPANAWAEFISDWK